MVPLKSSMPFCNLFIADESNIFVLLIKFNLVCIPFRAFSTCLKPDSVTLVFEFKLAVISLAALSEDCKSFTFMVLPVVLICSNVDFKLLANTLAFLNSAEFNNSKLPVLLATFLVVSIIEVTLENADSKLFI